MCEPGRQAPPRLLSWTDLDSRLSSHTLTLTIRKCIWVSQNRMVCSDLIALYSTERIAWTPGPVKTAHQTVLTHGRGWISARVVRHHISSSMILALRLLALEVVSTAIRLVMLAILVMQAAVLAQGQTITSAQATTLELWFLEEPAFRLNITSTLKPPAVTVIAFLTVLIALAQ